jgi:hypothetical protein
MLNSHNVDAMGFPAAGCMCYGGTPGNCAIGFAFPSRADG